MSDEALGIRVAQSEDYNFEAFSADEAYRETNRRLLTLAFAALPSPFYHVDVASGTGLVSQEVSRLCQEHGKRGTIIGIDPDHFAVESASRNTPSTPYCTVEFLEGRAQDMDRLLAGRIPSEGVDYVTIHDAIHEIEEDDKQSTIQYIAQILKPGGFFTYNSAFTTAALEQSAMIWGRWKAKAQALLGGKRNRNIKGLVTHTPAEYAEMISSAGLAIVHDAKESVRMSRTALEAIARYPRFVCGVFADLVGQERLSVEEKSLALLQALDDLRITEAPRVWHEVVARRPLPTQAVGAGV